MDVEMHFLLNHVQLIFTCQVSSVYLFSCFFKGVVRMNQSNVSWLSNDHIFFFF